MSYLGNTPSFQSFTSLTEAFSGDGSTTTFTLARTVYATRDIEVIVNNVQQDPFTSYTVNGTTTLTFTEAPSSGSGNILVSYRNNLVSVVVPTEGTVTAALFSAGSITGDKIGLTAINANNIVAASITGDKYGLTSINANNIVAAAITGDKIGLTAITSNLIAANAVTTTLIQDGAVNTSELAAGAVTGDKIAPTITLPNVNTGGATSFLSTVLESANVTTVMGSTTTINIASPLVVFTANSSANSTVNFMGLAGMPVGNTASFVIINPNGSTAYYINTYQVDNAPTLVRWAGGAPIGGTSANTDIYSFSIIKTSATPTYNIFASVQSFY